MMRIGIGGWNFEPWRGTFYPKGLPHAQELAHASARVTSIEINSTFYSAQKPETFKRWAGETPDDFIFSVKAPMKAVNRRELATAGEAIDQFLNGGVLELGAKLGPIFWQLAATKRFDPDDLSAFLDLFPKRIEGRTLRHALEVRHESFVTTAFVDIVRKRGIAVVYVESDSHPPIADLTADFVYARLQQTREDEPAGYPKAALKKWAARARLWEKGEAPDDLPRVSTDTPKPKPRDVFIYMISGAKVRAPAAAVALIEQIGK